DSEAVEPRLRVIRDYPEKQAGDEIPGAEREDAPRVLLLGDEPIEENEAAEHGEYPAKHRREIRGTHPHRGAHRIVLGDDHERQPEGGEHQPGPEILAVRYFHCTPPQPRPAIVPQLIRPAMPPDPCPCNRSAWSWSGAGAATASAPVPIFAPRSSA